MSLNITDAKNAGLGAVLDLEKVMNDLEASWTAPDVQRSKAILTQILLNQWQALQPELDQVKQQNPAAYDSANKAMLALRSRLAGKPTQGG